MIDTLFEQNQDRREFFPNIFQVLVTIIREITEYIYALNALCKKKNKEKDASLSRILTCLDILLIMNCQRTWISINRVIHLRHEIPICKSKRTFENYIQASEIS